MAGATLRAWASIWAMTAFHSAAFWGAQPTGRPPPAAAAAAMPEIERCSSGLTVVGVFRLLAGISRFI